MMTIVEELGGLVVASYAIGGSVVESVGSRATSGP